MIHRIFWKTTTIVALVFWSVPACSKPHPLIANELKVCGEAIKLANEQKWGQAVKLLKPEVCPLTTAVVTWMDLKREGGAQGFAAYKNFISERSHWPWMFALRNQAENLIDDTVTDREVINWCKTYPPKTLKANLRYIEALSKLGDKRAVEVIRSVWINRGFTQADEEAFLRKYGKQLRSQDHKARARERLKAEQVAQAKRMLRFLNRQDKLWANIRLALLTNAPKVSRMLTALPKQLASEIGIIYEQIRALRKRDDLSAIDLFLRKVPHSITKADFWWKERNYLAREALNKSKPELAYRMMRDHQFSSGESFFEAEWFLGWVSLEFLQKPKQAITHFQRLYTKSTTTVSKSKAAYWYGRAYESLGQQDKAKQWYAVSAESSTTYYGQLASQKLGKPATIKLVRDHKIVESEEFSQKEFVKISRLLAAAGNAQEALPFLYLLGERAKTKEERLLVLNLVREVLPSFAVRAAKALDRIEPVLLAWAYPTPWGEKDALLLALIRQESSFDPGVVSPAGAVGLAQLMPATAREIAKELQIEFSQGKLVSDPGYNIKLGKQYIANKLANFDNAKLLAIASYNAGERPVREWIRRNGDPRDNGVDQVNWIELIPYPETRTYVQRVLANLYVYTDLLVG